MLWGDEDFNGSFRNGHHVVSSEEFCPWFLRFLKKMSNPGNIRAGFTRRRDKPKMVKCIGVMCRGLKKFKSYYKSEHLCPYCKKRISQMRPLRIQRIGVENE